jgi:hypothetical protein
MDIERRIKRLEYTNRVLWTLFLLTFGILSTNYAGAANKRTDITANSIKTSSLFVANRYGKQGVHIEAGDSGLVSLTITDANGKQSVALLSDPSGRPMVCLSYGGKCRLALGDVYRGDNRELNFQLRDKQGKIIWMPDALNPAPSASR